jgi:ribosomal protein S18 acetylase RimI-like enzyme
MVEIVAFDPSHRSAAAGSIHHPHDPAAAGATALRDGRAVAFLAGVTREDEIRGPHAWVGLGDWGRAPEEPVDVLADLYAAVGGEWIRTGHVAHYVVVRAEDDAGLDTWFALGFGKEQVHARMPITGEPPKTHSGFSVRRGGPEDVERALDLADLIYREHEGGPVWSGLGVPAREDFREGWSETLAEDGIAYFVAEEEGRPLGHLLLVPNEPGVVELKVAATLPAARGRGVGTSLTQHALSWAHAEGYEEVVSDWRSANLSASRFWPGRGFAPYAYRLHRMVSHPGAAISALAR